MKKTYEITVYNRRTNRKIMKLLDSTEEGAKTKAQGCIAKGYRVEAISRAWNAETKQFDIFPVM